MVFHAVLESLDEDGADDAPLDVILARERAGNGERYAHFVYACPLCMPALDAMLAYHARPDFYGWRRITDTFGSGRLAAARERIEQGTFSDRLAVLQALVRTWIERRLARTRLSGAEREAWRVATEKACDEGMERLAFQRQNGLAGSFAERTACAVCDGARAGAGG